MGQLVLHRFSVKAGGALPLQVNQDKLVVAPHAVPRLVLLPGQPLLPAAEDGAVCGLPLLVGLVVKVGHVFVAVEKRLGRPQAQAVYRRFQLGGLVEGGGLNLPPVVHDVQLQNTAALPAAPRVAGDNLIPGEHAPYPGDGGHLVSKDPLPSDGYPVEPLAVLPNVLVHHGEQLLYRRGLLRVGQLGADGSGQGAFGGTKGVPQVGVPLVETQGRAAQAEQGAEYGKAPIPKLPKRPVLLHLQIEAYASRKAEK